MRGPPYYNESGIPHSKWVAVDVDGRLGLFECGEAGAVPLPWPLGTLPGDFFLDRFPLDALRAGRVVSGGRSIPLGGGRRVGRRVVAVLDRIPATATYRSELAASAFETRLGAERAWIVSESPRTIASTRAVDALLANTLGQDPAVARALDEDALALWIDALSDTGIFRWKSLDPEAVGLYARTDVPTRPIGLDELPERARGELGLVRFPVAFGELDVLQLADHFARADLVTRVPADALRRRPLEEPSRP